MRRFAIEGREISRGRLRAFSAVPFALFGGLLLVLTGCTRTGGELPEVPGLRTPAPTAAATRSLPTVAPSPARRVIGFGSIGELTVSDTAVDIADRLRAAVHQDLGNPSCEVNHYEADGGTSDAHLVALLGTLSASEGAAGHVDVLSLGGYGPTGEQSPTKDPALPATDSGITLGSTLAEVQEAYPDIALGKQHYEPELTQAVLTDEKMAMVFGFDARGVVRVISTGRQPQVSYVEGCA